MTGFVMATSIGDQLSTALQHTAIGMGTVFLVLIIMIAVISLFRYIPNPDAKKVTQKATQKVTEVKPVVVEKTAEEADDLALIAVITAAVAASMGTTNTNGFVVRSVKRVRTSNWKKA